MSGSLFDIVKRDAKQFVNSGGYEVDLQIITPDNNLTINITGWAVKHSGSFDTDGNQVNTKNVRATVDESVLIANGISVRNTRDEVSLLKYKVSFIDSTGNLKNYIVRENLPDENLGLIVLILGDYKPS